MKRKENRIGRVLALKRKLSLQAKAVLESARQDMMKAAELERQRTQALDDFGSKVVALREQSARDASSAADLFQRARMERQEATRLLAEAEELVEQRRESWLSLEKEIKSLELMGDRLRQARLTEEGRREQAFLDEVGAYLHKGPLQ